ncbi:tyrosine-protein phosphatase [Chitinophaga defluvii]|uniref:protein-tyrosine-phosphatase n=1 Tax=Chitinophaga defluvii TaxID=3163343 RepID=A0ABV2T0P7_9BACT
MFFFRRKNTDSQFLANFLSNIETDIHSHLIPGIDDGVQEVDTSVAFIGQLHELGIKKIITTPHIMMDRYPNSADTIALPFQKLQAALTEARLDIPFKHAAEYYMDEYFEELMKAPLLTLNGELVLVEISFMSAPPQLHNWIFTLEAQGYRPIMAHPERYAYGHANFDLYHQFKKMGCLLQVNLLSLTGYYGKHIQQAAEKLVADKMIDYIGTDLHHEKHLQAITAIGKNKKVLKVLDQYPFKNRELTSQA